MRLKVNLPSTEHRVKELAAAGPRRGEQRLVQLCVCTREVILSVCPSVLEQCTVLWWNREVVTYVGIQGSLRVAMGKKCSCSRCYTPEKKDDWNPDYFRFFFWEIKVSPRRNVLMMDMIHTSYSTGLRPKSATSTAPVLPTHTHTRQVPGGMEMEREGDWRWTKVVFTQVPFTRYPSKRIFSHTSRCLT